MPFIGNKPSAVPLTSADITDGIITSAKIADGTIVNADINASSAIALSKLSTTGTADATTFLRGDGAYTAVSSDFVKLGSTSASGSTSISVDGYFTSAYDFYMVRILGCTATVDGQDLHLRFNRSGSAVTTANYNFQIGRLYGSSTIDNSGDNNSTGYRVWYGTSGNEKTHATLWFYNPLASQYPSMWYNSNCYSSGNSFNLFGSVSLKTAGAISGFTLYNGTMSIDNITIYGMKD